MTGSRPVPRSSPRVVVGLLLVAALLGLLALEEPEAPGRACDEVRAAPHQAVARTRADPVTSAGPGRQDAGSVALPVETPPGTATPPAEQTARSLPSRQSCGLLGVVVDLEGRPRAGVRVLCRAGWEIGEREEAEPELDLTRLAVALDRGGRPWLERLTTTTTALDGSFELSLASQCLLPGMVVAAEDLSDRSIGLLRVEAADLPETGGRAQADRVDVGQLVLRPTALLELEVRAAGRPVEQGVVWATVQLGDDAGDLQEARALTGPEGTLALRLPAGRVELYVSAEGCVTALRRVRRPEGTVRLAVELERAVELRGTVTDPGGQPAPGVEVEAAPVRDGLGSLWARTDGAGRFVLERAAPGASYGLRVTDPRARLAPKETTAVASGSSVDVVLDLAGSLRLELVALDDGVLPGLPSFHLERAGPDGWEPTDALPEDPWGAGDRGDWASDLPAAPLREPLEPNQHRLVGLTPGRYRVSAEDRARSSSAVEVEVRAGEEATLTLTIAPRAD